MLAGRKTDGEIVNGACGVKKKGAGEKVSPEAILPTSVIFNSRLEPPECVNMGYCTACRRQTGLRGGRERHAQHANALRNKTARHEGKMM